MKIVQLTAGQGPAECHVAVAHALRRLLVEAAAAQVEVDVLEAVGSSSAYKSITLSLTGAQEDALSARWSGSMLWVCALRSGAARKNWFFSGASWSPVQPIPLSDITIDVCRSSGAGGQHVNTTNSAVRATHNATGLSVKIQSERSQHANKKTALALLELRLEEFEAKKSDQQKSEKRLAHHHMQRGNPTRTFEGEKFIERARVVRAVAP